MHDDRFVLHVARDAQVGNRVPKRHVFLLPRYKFLLQVV